MNKNQIKDILSLPIEEIISLANDARIEGIGTNIELCGIINAKSGVCSEDCKFCAQSGHYSTEIDVYSLRDKRTITDAARKSKSDGASRFGIVTSGNRLTENDLNIVCEAIKEMVEEIGILPCASLGALHEEDFIRLKDAGLTRYHHNIETSERFYPNIVSTHAYSERVNTVRMAKKVGMEVCSGGIFGLGETTEDRIDMAFLLKELEVDSVPLNFLVPIKGTPLENAEQISALDAVKIIALFRLVLKDKTIKVAAGRETVLKGCEQNMFKAGANGMMIGGYLTVKGHSLSEDQLLIEEIKKLWKT